MTRTDPRNYVSPDSLKATPQEQQTLNTQPHFAIGDDGDDVEAIFRFVVERQSNRVIDDIAAYNRRRAMWQVLWAVVGIGGFLGGCFLLARWIGGEQ